jgi:hypothetical protein
MEQVSAFADFKSQISDLRSRVEGCSRQLRAWAQNLLDSNIKGQRHVSKKAMAENEHEKERERIERENREFIEELRRQTGSKLP